MEHSSQGIILLNSFQIDYKNIISKEKRVTYTHVNVRVKQPALMLKVNIGDTPRFAVVPFVHVFTYRRVDDTNTEQQTRS